MYKNLWYELFIIRNPITGILVGFLLRKWRYIKKPQPAVMEMKNKGADTCVQQIPHPRKPRPYSGAVEHCTFLPYERRVQTRTISSRFHVMKHFDMIIWNGMRWKTKRWIDSHVHGKSWSFVRGGRSNSGIALRYHEKHAKSYKCGIVLLWHNRP